MSANSELKHSVSITAKNEIAKDIFRFEFTPDDEGELEAPEAGAHIYVEAPNSEVRRYSLSQSPDEMDHYAITVKRDEDGTGGSKSLCDETQVGDRIKISGITNDFELKGNPTRYVFIAGGIGITPLYSMIKTLETQGGKPFKLYYLTRDAEQTAYLEEFSQPEYKGKVTIHHTEGNPDNRYDLWPILEQPKGAWVYCCGPRELMEEVRDMTGHWSPSSVHFEDFGAGDSAHREDDVPFKVRVYDDGSVVEVSADQTAMEALRGAGYDIPSSCESGTCGTCRSALLAGEVDHRDLVLSDDEEEDNIMICVSRAIDDEIEIELPKF